MPTVFVVAFCVLVGDVTVVSLSDAAARIKHAFAPCGEARVAPTKLDTVTTMAEVRTYPVYTAQRNPSALIDTARK